MLTHKQCLEQCLKFPLQEAAFQRELFHALYAVSRVCSATSAGLAGLGKQRSAMFTDPTGFCQPWVKLMCKEERCSDVAVLQPVVMLGEPHCPVTGIHQGKCEAWLEVEYEVPSEWLLG